MGGAAVRGLCAAGAVGLAASANAAPRTVSPAEEAVGAPAADAADDDLDAPEPPPLPDPAGAKRLPPPDRVWVDLPQKQVYVDGFISLREGYLEMFACKKGTKEHESIVALQANAYVIHAALLAVGALPGSPVKFQPKFAPPSGAEIEVEVRWLDAAGRWQSARAQQWIRDAETGQPMQQSWVFAGSGMWKDEQSGKNYYMAEAGDVICVSNFGSAMLDVPMESSQSNEGLLFEANAEAIPPLGTPVRIVLTPKAGPPAGQPTAVGDKAAR
jgi:hypothetical protein